MGDVRAGTPSQRRVGTPSYAGDMSMPPDDTFAVDAPSVHFAGDDQQETYGKYDPRHTDEMAPTPEPEPEPEQKVSAEEGEAGGVTWNPRTSLPRISKRGVYLHGAPEPILFRSPRCKQALSETGVDKALLLPQPREHFALGAKMIEVVEKRYEAYEERRRKNLALLLERRQELVAAARDERQAAEGNSASERATMLKQEAEHQARILQAAKERMKEEQQLMLAAEEKKQANDESQRVIELKIAARKEEQDEVARERRKAIERERQRRKRLIAEKEAALDAQGRILESTREERQAKLDAEVRAREHKMRARALKFAEESAAKLVKIAELNAAKDVAAEAKAQEQAETAARRQVEREVAIAKRRKATAEFNRQKGLEAEKKRQAKLKADKRKKEKLRTLALQKLEAVDVRVEETAARKEAERKERAKIEMYKERERVRKQEMLKLAMVMTAGETMGKTEAKARAIEKAARRRALGLELRAEESRLNFAAKQENIQRQRRVAEHELYLATCKQEEKEARLDALLAGKYEMRQGRKMMAQDFQVQKQILAREVEEMNEHQRRTAYNAEQRRLLNASLQAPVGRPKRDAGQSSELWRGSMSYGGGGRRSAAF
eukprot:COSAG05_NODE_170_length_15101_cov_28.257684_6_plen_608_part_00